jgi:hypothetical protein
LRFSRFERSIIETANYINVHCVYTCYRFFGYKKYCYIHFNTWPFNAEFVNTSQDIKTHAMCVCNYRIIGFEIHKSSTFVYTGVVTITVVLSVLLLMWCCMQPDYSEDGNATYRQRLS